MRIGQQHRVFSLRYYLYDRALHPELFSIYRDHTINKPRYEAQIWVTGCTHTIGFFANKGCLTETICDLELDVLERGRIREIAFRGEKMHECRHVDGINYMVNFQLEQMTPMAYNQTHHELARQGANRGLFVPFPQWMNTPSLTPFTFIDYKAAANYLHVFAFHAFPDDLTLIKTQTIFELPGK